MTYTSAEVEGEASKGLLLLIQYSSVQARAAFYLHKSMQTGVDLRVLFGKALMSVMTEESYHTTLSVYAKS